MLTRTAVGEGQPPLLLFVDDDAHVVDGLRRSALGMGEILTCTDPLEALDLVDRNRDRLSVVVSDLRMPGMDGTELLATSLDLAPEATRVMLTGFADLDVAVTAIARAKVFRLLVKPCPTELFTATVADGVEQSRLQRSERVLLEQTLRGAVDALTDSLAVARPSAFSRAIRIRRLAVGLGERVGVEPLWRLEMAAPLSMVGAPSLSEDVLLRIHEGQLLGPEEEEQALRLRELARRVVSRIPRLEEVADIIALAAEYEPAAAASPRQRAEATLVLAATVLAVAAAEDALVSRGLSPAERTALLERRFTLTPGPMVVRALDQAQQRLESTTRHTTVPVGSLGIGMRLDADLRTTQGVLLLGRGLEVTETALAHLHHHRAAIDVDSLIPVSVLVTSPRQQS